MMTMVTKIKSFLRCEHFIISLQWKYAKWLTVQLIALTIGVKFIPLITPLLWAHLIDGLLNNALTFKTTILWLVAFLTLSFACSILNKILPVKEGEMDRVLQLYTDKQITRKMSQVSPSFFDDPLNSDMLSAARLSGTFIFSSSFWLTATLISAFSFVTGFSQTVSHSWTISVLFLISCVPNAVIQFINEQKMNALSLDNIPENRRRNYYRSILTSPAYAKELRLYNLKPFFKERYDNLLKKIRSKRLALFLKGAKYSLLGKSIKLLGEIGIIFWGLNAVFAQKMTLGIFIALLSLLKTTGTTFETLLESVSTQIEIVIPRIEMFISFTQIDADYTDESFKINGASDIKIEFQNVSFTYPNETEPTLRNVSFVINPQEKVALVGENGSGKTTIVKLLLRLYKPSSGIILLNNKNINDYSETDYHRIFSVCFQDISKYALSFRESIAISDLNNDPNDINIINSAHLADIDIIPDNLETPMTKTFDDTGIELSGGQWQKLAIARAFFRNSPFLVMDEPSSSLDPVAESEIFESFQSILVGRGGLLISHRLSIIQLVDKIILLENGAIIENGTHQELMRSNGKYCAMYKLQAEQYIKGANYH